MSLANQKLLINLYQIMQAGVRAVAEHFGNLNEQSKVSAIKFHFGIETCIALPNMKGT